MSLQEPIEITHLKAKIMKNSCNTISQDDALSQQDWLFPYAESLDFGEIHMKIDKETGLKAIVAVHNTLRGPAIGGTRCIPYATSNDALKDAMRLAQMMSYKAAACDLPHGGAKSVIMRPAVIQDRKAFFHAFGRFVDSLNGVYIAAVDSGTSPEDMDIVKEVTQYVTCTTQKGGGGGDPSPYTAFGVRRGIEAAVKFKLGRDNLEGVKVAIQGAGHVGYPLVKDLVARGAIVTIADISNENIQRCVDEFGVQVTEPEFIYDVECDVFAPCALGATINSDTIQRIKASIVAGSANNQLAHPNHGAMLHQHHKLYAPDFIINSGGLVHAAAIYDHGDVTQADKHIDALYETLLHIFERAKAENKPESEIAETIALEKLKPKK